MPEELKPCPFCGGEATLDKLTESSRSVTHSVECKVCDYYIGFGTPGEMTLRWNTRPAEVELQAQLAAAQSENLRLQEELAAGLGGTSHAILSSQLAAAQAQVETLTAERDAARKALCRVYQVMELPDGKHIADGDWDLIETLLKNGVYDAALQSQAQPEVYDDDLIHRCRTHGDTMYQVRPGDWRCKVCENEP